MCWEYVISTAFLSLMFLLVVNLLFPGRMLQLLGFCFLLMVIAHGEEALFIDGPGFCDNCSPEEVPPAQPMEISPGPGLQVLISGDIGGHGTGSLLINETALALWWGGRGDQWGIVA